MDDQREQYQIAKRASRELKSGDSVFLGPGIPQRIRLYMPEGVAVLSASQGDESADIFFLEAEEIDEDGYIIPSEATEHIENAQRYIVTMLHTDRDVDRESSKIKKSRRPKTGLYRKVDMIITDLAVIEVRGDGLWLKEVACNVTIQDILRCTEAGMILSEELIMSDCAW